MQPIPLREPRSTTKTGFALFALGFRPFFLLAGIWAVLSVALWAWMFATGATPANYHGYVSWHSHEMIFGYTLAVIAGFLLTATKNWTGVQTARGGLLATLVLLWLAGRILPWLGVPGWMVTLVEMLFPLSLAGALLVPLLKARQAHNYPFPVIILLLAVADLLTQPVLNLPPGWGGRGLYFAVYLVATLIAVMGGRVIPFFIERAVAGAKTRAFPLVDKVSIGGLALLAAMQLAYPAPKPMMIVAAVTGVANALRLIGWHHRGLWREPLLWVLYLGYGWVVAGLLLQASGAPLVLSLHALTTGAIGVLTLGMMPRVSLGHTGRPMRAPKGIPAAFVLINLAALTRVAPPMLFAGTDYRVWIVLSATLWCLAFALFVLRYAPILSRPRVDGQPG